MSSRSGAHKRPTRERKRQAGESLPAGINDIPTLIKKGFDPFHAAYTFIQNVSAHFAECVAERPELKKWAQAVEDAEDEYLPSGPPMSPLTGSFFWMWALYDLRIGHSADTLALCQIAVNESIQLNDSQLDALKKMAASRMGIYEHVGMEGPYVQLQELITNTRVTCHCPTRYAGMKGQLWYVRLLPPLEPSVANYWVAMTTPYVMVGTKKSDWIEFLKRTLVRCDGSSDEVRLHNLFKYGLEPNYWNEFVTKAYVNYQFDAVFLTGIPDLEATMPHA